MSARLGVLAFGEPSVVPAAECRRSGIGRGDRGGEVCLFGWKRCTGFRRNAVEEKEELRELVS